MPFQHLLCCFFLTIICHRLPCLCAQPLHPSIRLRLGHTQNCTRSLPVSTLQAAGGTRNKIAGFNNGFAAVEIDRFINLFTEKVGAEGNVVDIFFRGKRRLLTACQSSRYGGTFNYFGSRQIPFVPIEIPWKLVEFIAWRADGYFGRKNDMTRANNEVEI